MARIKVLMEYTSIYGEAQTAIYSSTGSTYETGASDKYKSHGRRAAASM